MFTLLFLAATPNFGDRTIDYVGWLGGIALSLAAISWVVDRLILRPGRRYLKEQVEAASRDARSAAAQTKTTNGMTLAQLVEGVWKAQGEQGAALQRLHEEIATLQLGRSENRALIDQLTARVQREEEELKRIVTTNRGLIDGVTARLDRHMELHGTSQLPTSQEHT